MQIIGPRRHPCGMLFQASEVLTHFAEHLVGWPRDGGPSSDFLIATMELTESGGFVSGYGPAHQPYYPASPGTPGKSTPTPVGSF
jgi:hypothetical protein